MYREFVIYEPLKKVVKTMIRISFNEHFGYHLRKTESCNSSVLSSGHFHIIKIVWELILILEGHHNSKFLFQKGFSQGLQQCFDF